MEDNLRAFLLSILESKGLKCQVSERGISVLETGDRFFPRDNTVFSLKPESHLIDEVEDDLDLQGFVVVRFEALSEVEQTAARRDTPRFIQRLRRKGRVVHTEPTEPSVPVEVYLPNADANHDREHLEVIQYCVGHFLEEFGIELDPEHVGTVSNGSWRWLEWFKPKERATRAELKNLYSAMKEALERKHIDNPGADAFAKRAEAAAKLIAELDDNAFVRIGDVLIIKARINGEQLVVVETISPAIARLLDDKQPRNPAKLIEQLHALATTDESTNTLRQFVENTAEQMDVEQPEIPTDT